MAVLNTTGNHKLKSVMIGKSVKPRYLNNVNIKALSLIYTNKSKDEQRNIWFLDTFVPE